MIRTPFFLPAILLAAAALAVGCGSDSDALTLDEYFTEFATIDAESDAAIEQELEIAFEGFDDDDALFEDEANLPRLKTLSAAFPRTTGEFLDRLQSLAPPSEVQAEHDTMIEALSDLRDAFAAANDAFSEATTIAEFVEIEGALSSSDVEPAARRYDAACLAVLAVGEANDVDVSTITCQDD